MHLLNNRPQGNHSAWREYISSDWGLAWESELPAIVMLLNSGANFIYTALLLKKDNRNKTLISTMSKAF